MFYPVKNSIVIYGDGKGSCLTAQSDTIGSEFTTAVCDIDDPLQNFCWMDDGTIRLNDNQDMCFVTTVSMDAEAKRYKQPNHPYTARDFIIWTCADTPDKNKLWQTYDQDGRRKKVG